MNFIGGNVKNHETAAQHVILRYVQVSTAPRQTRNRAAMRLAVIWSELTMNVFNACISEILSPGEQDFRYLLNLTETNNIGVLTNVRAIKSGNVFNLRGSISERDFMCVIVYSCSALLKPVLCLFRIIVPAFSFIVGSMRNTFFVMSEIVNRFTWPNPRRHSLTSCGNLRHARIFTPTLQRCPQSSSKICSRGAALLRVILVDFLPVVSTVYRTAK